MRRKITIPADGESLNVAMTGASIVVESIPLYETPDDVPLLGFNSGDNQFPLYPRSTYTWPACFNNIVIVGTAESAGDEIILISFSDCLKSEVNINYKDSYKSYPGTSFAVDLNNVTDELVEADLINAGGFLPKKIFVSVREADAVWILNPELDTDPAQSGGTGLGTIMRAPDDTNNIPGDFLEIEGLADILAFRFRARVAGQTPVMTVHTEY